VRDRRQLEKERKNRTERGADCLLTKQFLVLRLRYLESVATLGEFNASAFNTTACLKYTCRGT